MVLGEGGYGKVYRGQLRGTLEVAVKVALRPNEQMLHRFRREIMLLKACHDPHIVQFLGASIDKERSFLVMEYMPEGNLLEKLRSDQAQEFSWYQRGARIALDVAAGLVYLHSCRIVHLDIKSANILLTSDLRAKIADVGLGKPLMVAAQDEGNTRTASAAFGTLAWAAPEQLMGLKCSTASDIFSMGVLLWEICTMELPTNRVYRKIEAPRQAPLQIVDVIGWCLQSDPKLRPSAVELHAILQNANFPGA